MNKEISTNKRNRLFLLALIISVVFIICSSFSLALNSSDDENDITVNSQNVFSNFSAGQIENNSSLHAISNDDTDTSDSDLLDYNDYGKTHRILDRTNTNVYIHLPGTFVSKKTFLFHNLFPQYPPIEKVIRLKNFLI